MNNIIEVKRESYIYIDRFENILNKLFIVFDYIKLFCKEIRDISFFSKNSLLNKTLASLPKKLYNLICIKIFDIDINVVIWPSHLIWHITISKQFYKVIIFAHLKLLIFLDLQSIFSIRPITDAYNKNLHLISPC